MDASGFGRGGSCFLASFDLIFLLGLWLKGRYNSLLCTSKLPQAFDSQMSRPITSMRFPGESTWEIWRCNRAGKWELSMKAELNDEASVHAIQTMCLDSSPFWSSTQGDEVPNPDDVSILRWEALGVSDMDGARQSTCWKVLEQPHRELIASMAITPDLANDESLGLSAEQYDISARLLPLPRDGLAIWKELGRIVTAFTRDGKLLHVTLIAAPELNADTALELRDALLALDAHEFLDRLSEVKVWTECEAGFLSALSSTFSSSQVQAEPRPAPMPAADPLKFVPMQVALVRRSQQERKRLVQLATALAAVFVVVFASWFFLLWQQEQKILTDEKALQNLGPQVFSVQEAKQAWVAMEAAVNPDLYPVELYHQIISLLPPSGVRLNEFQIDNDKITVRGEASDTQKGLDFREQLTNSPALSGFDWNIPVPKSLDGTRVQFDAMGIYNPREEVPREGQ